MKFSITKTKVPGILALNLQLAPKSLMVGFRIPLLGGVLIQNLSGFAIQVQILYWTFRLSKPGPPIPEETPTDIITTMCRNGIFEKIDDKTIRLVREPKPKKS